MRRAAAFLLLVCSSCLVAGLQLGQSLAADGLLFRRFGRQLTQVDGGALNGVVPLYLVPSVQPELCPGPFCCQADDYASPYRVQHLGSSTTTSLGQVFTSFHMQLVKQQYCNTGVDEAGCCNADIQKIRIDVDPELKVVFASIDGSPAAVTVGQNDLGFSMALSTKLLTVNSNGHLLTLTVAGQADVLCAISEVTPIRGLCNIIVEGGTDANAEACCPQSLSLAATGGNFEPPQVACVAKPKTSGYEMLLQSVTEPYSTSATATASNYTYVLHTHNSCLSTAPNSCCNMDINRLQMDILSAAVVENVEMGGNKVPFVVTPGSGSSLSSLTIDHLAITSSMIPSASGLDMIVTVNVPSGSNVPPHLCTESDGNSYGPCSYSLRSTNQFCCPGGATSSVLLGASVMSPPPSLPPGVVAHPPPTVLAQPPDENSSPSPPPMPPFAPVLPNSCSPTVSVPLQDSSMGLQYYEGPSLVGSSTSFVFMVSNHNSTSCSKPFCQDVCGWTLFINPDLAADLAFVAEDSINGDMQQVASGANASVTFKYGSMGEGVLLYSILAPGALPLSAVCHPNALPGQGTKACAAIVRGPLTYSVVFFDQQDVIITAPPAMPPTDFCAVPKALSESCVRIDNGAYNSVGQSTVFVFTLSDHSATAPGCTAAGGNTQFMVLLSSSAASELQNTQETLPGSSILQYDGGSQGVAWSWVASTSSGVPVHHGFKLGSVQSPAQACAQGVFLEQAAGTCAVAVMGDSCFRGYIAVSLNSVLQWGSPESRDGGSSSGSVAGIAVGVTLGILLLLATLSFFIIVARRRKNANAHAAANTARGNLQWDSFTDLTEPLTATRGGDQTRTI